MRYAFSLVGICIFSFYYVMAMQHSDMSSAELAPSRSSEQTKPMIRTNRSPAPWARVRSSLELDPDSDTFQPMNRSCSSGESEDQSQSAMNDSTPSMCAAGRLLVCLFPCLKSKESSSAHE